MKAEIYDELRRAIQESVPAATATGVSGPATGKIMRTKGMKSHNRRKKAPRVKRKFDKMFEMDSTNAKGVRRMLPNGLK